MSEFLQKETEFVSLELLDSRDAYDSFYKSQPESTPKVPFLRVPNDEKNNVWVFPYPQDIWDYWINKGIAPGPHVFDRQPENYIDPPLDNIAGGYPIQPFSIENGKTNSVYPSKYRRLWDFIYNPEFFLTPSLEGQRRIPFPHYRLNGDLSSDGRLPSLIPPFLPDVIYPNHPSLPYSKWQYALFFDTLKESDVLLDPSSVMAQKAAFVRAYGSKPNNTPEKYAFDPVNVTQYEDTGPLIPTGSSSVPYAIDLLNLEKQEKRVTIKHDRVIFYQPKRPDFSHLIVYPVLTTRSPIPYPPIVIHDANVYETSGWYYFFRQKVRRSSSFLFPQSPTTYRQLVEARKLLQELQRLPETAIKNTSLLIEEVALRVLAKQSSIYLGIGTYDPEKKFYEAPKQGTLTPEQRAAYEILIALKQLIITSLNNSPHELVFDEYGDPVYEETPYKIVTLHVIRGPRIIDDAPLSVSFNYEKQWTLTVPAFLNISQPGYLDTERNNRDIEWIPQGVTASLVRFNLDRGSNHHIDLSFGAPGEYFILCKIRRGYTDKSQGLLPDVTSYLFKFLNYELTFKMITQLPTNPIPVFYEINTADIPFGDEATVVPLRFQMDKNYWYEHKFADPFLMSIIEKHRSPLHEIEEYLSLNQSAVRSTHVREQPMGSIILSKYEQIFSQSPLSYTIYAVDPSRPFIFLRHSNNPYHAYLIAVIYTTARIPVDFFGSTITLKTFLPLEECNTGKFYVTWSNAQGGYLTDTSETTTTRIKKTGPSLDLTIKHPRQLTTYFAHVHLQNDTCTGIPENPPLYTLSYQVFIGNTKINTRTLLFQGIALDEKGNQSFEVDHRVDSVMRFPRSIHDPPQPFFEAMCRVYALLYKIDLYNFDLFYPFVTAYCEQIDFLIRNYDPEKRIVILDDVPQEMKGLVPPGLHPPYLFPTVSRRVTVYGNEPIYYIIFDPSRKRWINLAAIKSVDEPIEDPRLVVLFGKDTEYVLEKISRYYPYVPINTHLFMTPNEIYYKNEAQASLDVVTITQPPPLIHDPTTIPDISSFLLHIREAVERANSNFRQISASGSTQSPALQNKLINTFTYNTRQSFSEADNAILYDALYQGESKFMNYIRKVSFFLREIRRSLGEPILFRDQEITEETAFQSSINAIIHQRKREMSELEYLEHRESFMSLYAALRRIGDADLGFLFLDNKYPLDYMIDNTPQSHALYRMLSQFEIPLVLAFSMNKTVPELVDALISHYFTTQSMRLELSNRVNDFSILDPSIPNLTFSFNPENPTDQRISDYVTNHGAPPSNFFYINWNQYQWTCSPSDNPSFIYNRNIYSLLISKAFKMYFSHMFDLLERTTKLSLFEIILILFMRTVGYFQTSETMRHSLWSTIEVYQEFKRDPSIRSRFPETLGDIKGVLSLRDTFMHTYRGRFTSIWPFHLHDESSIVQRTNLIKEISDKFRQQDPPPTEKEINRFNRNTILYMIPEYAFVYNPSLHGWEEFKTILWRFYPTNDLPSSKQQIEPIDTRYSSPIFNNTIVADAYRYVLTFFEFSGNTLK